MLGTFITEWDDGRRICDKLLETEESARMYAERLAELAVALGFDGWLVCSFSNLKSRCFQSEFIFDQYFPKFYGNFIVNDLS